jgi:putative ABC transport system permease protein
MLNFHLERNWKGKKKMFQKILKKDLKRKKVMNIILLIFMLTACILIASSTNLLYSTITAVDYFVEKSNVASVISITGSNATTSQTIENWAKNNRNVTSYMGEDCVMLKESNVTASTGKELKDTGFLIVTTKPTKFNLVFDPNGRDFEVGPSEAAVPVSIQKKMGLNLGDRLTIVTNGNKKDFTISCIFKDAVFGSAMVGMKRIIISSEDFNYIFDNAEEADRIQLWGFEKKDGIQNKDLASEFSDMNVFSYATITKDVISTAYVMDMMLAAVMIIVSIFLILISFLILRFTIVFTVMEDYKQIGVMKAIGLKNSSIRGMYSIKYFILSVVSGLIGYLISFPIAFIMKKDISEYILLKESAFQGVISLLSVILVVGVTILFCSYSTGKIKRISAIDAIRQGNIGERFKNTRKISLHHRKWIRVPLFLAISDIVSDFKKFIILIITFALGTAIIIIPNNIINTISSNDSITLFGYSKSDFYIRKNAADSKENEIKHMKELQNEFQKEGFETSLRAELMTTGKALSMDKSVNQGVLILQGIGIGTDAYDYLEGTPPVLKNEIAITEKTATILNVGVGDSILCEIQGETKEFIISALFQSLNNLGHSIRVSEAYPADGGIDFQVSGILEGASSKEKAKLLIRLKESFPELDIKTGKEVVNVFTGNITAQIAELEKLILLIVLGINILMTALLLRMLMSKEIPEIAILKSLGFYQSSIKLWQMFRIGIILLLSILLGTIVANTTGNVLAAGIFRIMGVTRLKLTIVPLQVYLIYPAIIFVATMAAVICSLGRIKKTHVWELNNQE